MKSCNDCAKRRQLLRDALINAKIREAIGHAVFGVAEATGIKRKSNLTPKKGKE